MEFSAQVENNHATQVDTGDPVCDLEDSNRSSQFSSKSRGKISVDEVAAALDKLNDNIGYPCPGVSADEPNIQQDIIKGFCNAEDVGSSVECNKTIPSLSSVDSVGEFKDSSDLPKPVPDLQVAHTSDSMLPNDVITPRENSDVAPSKPSEDNVPAVQSEEDLGHESHFEQKIDSDSQNESADIKQESENSPVLQTSENIYPKYEFEGDIQMITGSWSDFDKCSEECYTKGCKWAPDGTCILTNSDDNVLRVFDVPRELHCQESWPLGRMLPEMTPALKIRVGGQVYDYCWYPLMSSDDPHSCCMVSTSQHTPIHMWDAYTGANRCTYRPYNEVDEIEHAYSVSFGPSGEKLYCGFRNKVRVFDTCNPGRVCTTRSLKGCGRSICIISSICVNPVVQKLYVVGSYSKTIALCSEPDGKVLCLFCGQGGGVTHLAFSPDGSKLFSGCRKDSEIVCWDLRNLGTVLYAMEREVTNHQRIYFDISSDGHYLMSGGTNGKVTVWDLHQPPTPTSTNRPILPALNRFQANNDSVNGISLHKQYPILATSSGQRHFEDIAEDDSDDERAFVKRKKSIHRGNGLKLWWLGKTANTLSNS